MTSSEGPCTVGHGSTTVHIQIPIKPHYKKLLDVGCGKGHMLRGLNLSSDIEAFGIDIDPAEIEAAKHLAGGNIKLSVGRGEELPYPDESFDFVMCSVALPYMRVGDALSEMNRVLRPGGDIWLWLHPTKYCIARASKSFKHGKFKDVLYCGFIVLNGLIFSIFGKQIMFNGRTETSQTRWGMRRALTRAGFKSIEIERHPYFVAQATKNNRNGRSTT